MTAAQIRGALEKLSPRWIDPPVLQPAALYLELSGEELRRRAFLVADENGAELCLRPDMTVPALRAALAAGVKRGVIAYEGLVFRRQSEASARESEFVQIGAEWLGPSDDAAIVATALEACGAAAKNATLKLGDLALVGGFVAACAFAAPWQARVKRALTRAHGLDLLRAELAAPADGEGAALADSLSQLDEARAEAALADLLAVSRITPVGGRSIADIARRLRMRGEAARAPKPTSDQLALLDALMHVDAPIAEALKQVEALTKHKGVAQAAPARAAFEAAAAHVKAIEAAAPLPKATRFAPGMGRGLAYYDGFLFELEAPALGDRASLGGGGRYDALVARLSGEKLEGAGFALRPARVAEAQR
ncbi:MAG: ATP phosphoribosyltransferase regulatory subunit [Hyphomonadaceae bacterium]